MFLAVLSPETDFPNEKEIVAAMFAHGLARYHLRKPTWTWLQTQRWLDGWSREDRARCVVHHHHDLVAALALGGRHWRDDDRAPLNPVTDRGLTSRSCHDLAGLESALGRYHAVFFSPIFPSLSKPGYEPLEPPGLRLRALLEGRNVEQRSTQVLALGGVSAERLDECRERGFDGVGLLGAIWQAPDPVTAFTNFQSLLLRYAA